MLSEFRVTYLVCHLAKIVTVLLLQFTAHLHHESTENDVRVLVATIVEGVVLLKKLIGVSVINILLKEIAGD